MYQILYHEFTHIVDRLIFFLNEKDEIEQRSLLFPYTEFHAAQIEMKKKLELFYNPSKVIEKSTKIYDVKCISTLGNFLKDEQKDFDLRVQKLEDDPTISNAQSIIYILIYNIGHYSVCYEYNINKDLFINPIQFPYIKEDIEELKELLLYRIPSETLCKETSFIAKRIFAKIASEYNVV